MGIAASVDDAITGLLNATVSSKSAALSASLAPLAITGATVYFIMMGFAYARGDVSEPLHSFVWKAIKITFLAGLSLAAGEYQTTILNGWDALEIALIESISGSTSVGNLIDDLAKPFADLGEQLWNEAVVGYVPNLALLFAAGMVAIAELFIFGLGLGFYLLAKVGLAVVLAVGPAFLMCAMWPGTEKYTETWIGQALNFVILKVLVATSIVMLTSFVSQFAQHIAVSGDTSNVITATTSLMLACGALGIVMLNLPQIAAALSGGASISGIGRTVAHALIHKLGRPGNPGPSAKSSTKGGGSISPARTGSTGAKTSAALRKPLYQRNTIEQLHTKR